ncbi:MAG: polysaccharide deacetylase family protein [Streptosporangiales bacterium]|nr:polysaccharide deacetylase family protein [Streptosporangiales bacterium]
MRRTGRWCACWRGGWACTGTPRGPERLEGRAMARQPRTRARLTVLTWHNVDPTPCFPARPGTGRRGLARQLAFCRRYANVLPLEVGVQALREGRPLPPRAVALTFDDGYRDNLAHAVPLLARLGLPATFFLVPGLLSGTAPPWWEVATWTVLRARAGSVTFAGRSYALRTPVERTGAARRITEVLKRRTARGRRTALAELADRCAAQGRPPGAELFLDWESAKDLVRHGFAVGSHSMEHNILALEDAENQRDDLVRSRYELEDRLQVPVDHLAYPNGKPGDCDEATFAAAASAGYAAGFTTMGGRNIPETPRYELRRFVLNPNRGPAAFALLPRQMLRIRGEEGTCGSCT